MESNDNVPSFLKRGPSVLIDCRVEVANFEGPLDLLLHLIKTHELDIQTLSISKITRQYLSYLNYMRELNLDLASEYLVMAATLTYLKSEVILPRDETEEATGHDPRSQLIRRLIELKNYKELARELSERPRMFRDVFPCRNTGAEEIQEGLEAEVALTNPFQMAKAYKDLIERRKTHIHSIYMEEVPVAKSVERIAKLFEMSERMGFKDLLPQDYKVQDFVSTFLAVLEMTRMQFTTIEQEEIYGALGIVRKVDAEDMDRANAMIRGGSWN
ncbi:MAG: segregation/condensation protein A [Bdellovibrionota bacterium]